MRIREQGIFESVRSEPTVQRFEEVARHEELVTARVALHVPVTDLTHVGLSLYHLDLEMRRTAALYFNRAGKPTRPRALPLPVSTGGLKVVDIAPGSVDVVLEAVGLVATMLASAPVTAFVNTVTILDWFDRIRLFRPARDQGTFEGRAEDLGAALERFGASMEPDAELEPNEMLARAEQSSGVRIRLADGTRVRARRAAIELQRKGDSERLIILAD